ncbi:MAG: hypothetical protein ACYTBJ_27365 [Planctomycetota bacterium]
MDRIAMCRCSMTEPDTMDDVCSSGYFMCCPVCGWTGPIEATEEDAIDAWNTEMADARG